jgi:hypothetical protein
MVSETPRDQVVDTFPTPGTADPWPAQDVVVGPAGGIEARSAPYFARPAVAVTETVYPVRNRVQWGPILAGVAATLTAMLVFTALGLAIGTSAFEPGTDVTDWGTSAGIYGVAAALLAFFIGGWMAARTAAVGGEFAGLTNGFVAGAVSLMGLVWLSTTGLVNLVGFLGNNLYTVANAVSDGGSLEDAADTAAANTGVTFSDVEKGAWMTFAVIVAALVASALGGWLGHRDRAEVVDRA